MGACFIHVHQALCRGCCCIEWWDFRHWRIRRKLTVFPVRFRFILISCARLASVERYDPVYDQWQIVTAMQHKRGNLAAAVLNSQASFDQTNKSVWMICRFWDFKKRLINLWSLRFMWLVAMMATHIIRPLSAMTQSLILGAPLSPCVFVGVGWPLQLLDKGKSFYLD